MLEDSLLEDSLLENSLLEDSLLEDKLEDSLLEASKIFLGSEQLQSKFIIGKWNACKSFLYAHTEYIYHPT